MKLKILAKSDREVYLGFNDEFDYVVISLDDTIPIELGDVLSSKTWDDYDDLFKEVRNLTQRENVRICIESWSCNRALGYDFLNRLNSPTKITTIEAR